VPYIHCPQCRLTIYGGSAYNADKRCPRCDAEMSHTARPMFRNFALGAVKQKSDPPARGGEVAGSG
jgi:hypothetical protein